jgi:hypothetical protein
MIWSDAHQQINLLAAKSLNVVAIRRIPSAIGVRAIFVYNGARVQPVAPSCRSYISARLRRNTA